MKRNKVKKFDAFAICLLITILQKTCLFMFYPNAEICTYPNKNSELLFNNRNQTVTGRD